jgi:hypothetical protein
MRSVTMRGQHPFVSASVTKEGNLSTSKCIRRGRDEPRRYAVYQREREEHCRYVMHRQSGRKLVGERHVHGEDNHVNITDVSTLIM